MSDKLLQALLKAFDEKIDEEKGSRDECQDREERIYANGRVDGVDAGRYLVEKVFSQAEVLQ